MRKATRLPRGSVAFMFTDIEGSTRLWELYPDAMAAALARHDGLLKDAITAHGGAIFKTGGDAFCVAFGAAPDAVSAALAAQCALHAEPWPVVDGAPDGFALRVRVALHSGAAQVRDGDYFGPPLNRCARLLAAGHGGQTLLTKAISDRVRDTLPDGAGLRDLAVHRLKDLRQPEHVFQLVHPSLPTEFPPLRTLEALADELPPQAISFIGHERAAADRRGVVMFLEERATEAVACGEAERAARLFGAAASLREELGAPRPREERDEYEDRLSEVGAQLGPQAFAAAWTEGWGMSLEQAVEYALEG